MTPEAYIAAVKACPRIAWSDGGNAIARGYLIRRNYTHVVTVSDSELLNRRLMRWNARKSTDSGNLFADTTHLQEECFFGKIPHKAQLQAPKKGFFNWLFHEPIDDAADYEWVKEQIKKQKAEFEAASEANFRKREAEEKAEHEAQMRKRSYWTFLDGYAFESATVEVLNKHQFNAVVTPGSGDGGVDIEVTRNGLKGVVQCKAHMARIGPHVVRDLYDVIHHRAASFGIIVSLDGFSRGAVDFARDKPILFVDISDLIAMQQGRDVLANAFSRKDS